MTDAMVFTFAPRLATSRQIALVALFSAPLAAAQFSWRRLPVKVAIEKMLMTRPKRVTIIGRISGWVTRKKPFSRTSMTQ